MPLQSKDKFPWVSRPKPLDSDIRNGPSAMVFADSLDRDPGMPQPPALMPLSEADYDLIEAAVMETGRGRWFLAEYPRRNRHSDTMTLLRAIDRLGAAIRGEPTAQAVDRIRLDLFEMAKAIARTKAEIAAIKPDVEDSGKFGEVTAELDSIVQTTETATSDILAAAEQVQEIAWTLREQGIEPEVCDLINAKATDIYTACAFQDLTGQRTGKVIQVLEQRRVHIATGQDRDGDLAAHVDLSRQQRGERDRAARLDHEFELAEREGDRGGDLGIADGDALADQRAIDRERHLSRHARQQCVANRSGDARVGLAAAALERARVIVEPLRLRGVDPRTRAFRLDGERNPGREAAPGRRDRDHVRLEPHCRQLFDDLAAGGALAGDDQRIVVGRYQGRVPARGDLAGDRLAVLMLAIVEHDFGAELGGALALGSRRVAGHDDDGRRVEQLRGCSDPLRMIAGRIGDHAAGAALGRKRGDLVVGAAELERPGALQGLGLEKHPCAGARIEHRGSEQRGPQSYAPQASGGRLDVGGGRKGRARLDGGGHRPEP